jgi:hypothetical protein
VPVPYPASCSPQAWASAAPVHLIRMLLRFDPVLIWNELWLAPALPPGTHFRLDDMPLAGQARLSLDIDMTTDSVQVHGLPDPVKLHLGARPPLSELFDLPLTAEPSEIGRASEASSSYRFLCTMDNRAAGTRDTGQTVAPGSLLVTSVRQRLRVP